MLRRAYVRKHDVDVPRYTFYFHTSYARARAFRVIARLNAMRLISAAFIIMNAVKRGDRDVEGRVRTPVSNGGVRAGAKRSSREQPAKPRKPARRYSSKETSCAC